MDSIPLNEVENLLFQIEHGTREEDIKVLSAIRSEFGDEAYEMCREWWRSYDGTEGGFNDVWKSLRVTHCKIGTLIHIHREQNPQLYNNIHTTTVKKINNKPRPIPASKQKKPPPPTPEVNHNIRYDVEDFDHPYLRAKNIHDFNMKMVGSTAMIPMSLDGVITGHETINMEAKSWKKARSFGSKNGFCVVDADTIHRDNVIESAEKIYICESVANCIAVRRSLYITEPVCYVVCCFGAGQIVRAVEHYRGRAENIIIVADDDFNPKTTANVGVESAINAWESLYQGGIVIPQFKSKTRSKIDIADVYQEEGAEGVKRCLERILYRKYRDNNDDADYRKLDLSDLNHVLIDAVKEVAEKTQSSAELAILPALSCASIAVQHIYDLYDIVTDRRIPLSIGCLTVASSGEGKSPVFEMFQKPLSDARQDVFKRDFVKQKTSLAKHKAWEKTLENIDIETQELEYTEHLNKEPGIFHMRQIVRNIETAQSTLKTISAEKTGAIMSSEGGEVLFSYALSDKEAKSSMGIFNELLDGRCPSKSTITRGDEQACSVRFGIGIMTQKVTIDAFAAENPNAISSGFMPRMLISVHQNRQTAVQRARRPTSCTALKNLQEIIRHNAALLDEIDPDNLYTIEMTEEAEEVYNGYWNALENSYIEAEGKLTKPFHSKAKDSVLKIAAVLALNREKIIIGKEYKIGVEDIEISWRINQYSLGSAEFLFESKKNIEQELSADAKKLKKILDKFVKDNDEIRQISTSRQANGGLLNVRPFARSRKILAKSLDELENSGDCYFVSVSGNKTLINVI